MRPPTQRTRLGAILPNEHDLTRYLDRVLAEALGSVLVTEGPRTPQEVWALAPELSHAADLASVDSIGLADTRMRALKRFVARMNRPQMHRQAAFNRSVVAVAGQLTAHLAGVVSAQEQQRTAMASRSADLRVRLRSVEDAAERLERLLHQRREQVDRELSDAASNLKVVDAEFRALHASLDHVRRELRELSAGSPGAAPARSDVARRERLDAVYERFEDAFRGDRADITERLSIYLDDVVALKDGDHPVVDVGTGRGEWLELLASKGIPAIGVDNNTAMVARCRASGLDARLADAVDYLASLEPGSIGAVTSFHVVEHLPLFELVALLDAARRAVVPGGKLILETPNPTNLLVGAATFFRDPTHVRPLHPDLLRFLAEEAGFVDVEVRFLHPVEDDQTPSTRVDLSGEASMAADLHWALRGPQDFSLVAHVPAGR